jgi:TPR repeat protein
MNPQLVELARKAANCDNDALLQLQSASQLEVSRAEASFLLGQLFDTPSPLFSKLQPNPTDARRFYLIAAELGLSLAQMSVGNMFDYGEGGDQDSEQARYWYAAAAENGVRDAQMHFGRMLEMGRGGAKDSEAAARWYMKAVEQGDELAATNLATMHLRGDVRDPDMDLALSLLQFSAEKLDGLAHLMIASLYREGKVLEQDGGRALHHNFIASLLLPPGPNRDMAIQRRDGALSQHPDMRAKFEELATDYIADHGGQISS